MFAVGLADLLTIRRKQRHCHIYPPFGDYNMHVLSRDHRDLVGMRLTTGKLSFDGLTWFQRNTILSAWRLAAFTSGRLHRHCHWPRSCSSRRPSPDEHVDHESGPAD